MSNSITYLKLISYKFNLGRIEIFMILLSFPFIEAYFIPFRVILRFFTYPNIS